MSNVQVKPRFNRGHYDIVSPNSDWTFTHHRNIGAVGFTYKATLADGRVYYGQKRYDTKRTLPPLKGYKRKRVVRKEGDWRTYRSSNVVVKKEAVKFELLHQAYTLAELNALEAYHILTAWFKGENIVNSWVEKKIILPKLVDTLS